MRCLFLTLLLAAASLEAAPPSPPPPLQQAHSHNDYDQKRPLAEALDHGFCSVEADIHLVDGQLLVAHDRVKTRPDRTLRSMYLDPLRERCRTNGGFVHPATNAFTLLIDIKADAEGTYRLLDPLLREYQSILTRFTPHQLHPARHHRRPLGRPPGGNRRRSGRTLLRPRRPPRRSRP
jgi:hypothetical protein